LRFGEAASGNDAWSARNSQAKSGVRSHRMSIEL